jgi:RNA polymerase sigma factor (TIGR02999 family)
MTSTPHKDLTEFFLNIQFDRNGKPSDTDKIFEIVYNELRNLASSLMRHERPDHTLQPTALVHEAYCRLVDQTRIEWQNRAHFFGIAARAMRQILIDRARKRAAVKRGGDLQRVTLDERLGIGVDPDIEIFELDNAMKRLARMDERMARVVELRIFGGMNVKEIAYVFGVTRRTIQNDWKVARMWLIHELSEEAAP